MRRGRIHNQKEVKSVKSVLFSQAELAEDGLSRAAEASAGGGGRSHFQNFIYSFMLSFPIFSFTYCRLQHRSKYNFYCRFLRTVNHTSVTPSPTVQRKTSTLMCGFDERVHHSPSWNAGSPLCLIPIFHLTLSDYREVLCIMHGWARQSELHQ